MKEIKSFLRKKYNKVLVWKEFFLNFFYDSFLFFKYSLVFDRTTYQNYEAELILHYHALEKGMLHKEIKFGFAKNRVEKLNYLLQDETILNNIMKSQVLVAYKVMCKYYEIHFDHDHDISSYFTFKEYEIYKELLQDHYSRDFNPVNSISKECFYDKINSLNFSEFAMSRKSIRNFTGELVCESLITSAIELSNTAPSVCNRQASNIYLINDKKIIDSILQIQGGFSGYTLNVKQLLVLTNDRRYYYTIGERNQFYIDGGIYLMNLLYSLHYFNIAHCPANWGKVISEDKKAHKILNIDFAEKIICVIPIGIPQNEIRTTLSLRRPISENFKIIN